jgi:hypothetical protein
MARTVAQIVKAVDDVCPNAFDYKWKAAKIGTLDGEIWLNVLLGDSAEIFEYGIAEMEHRVLVDAPFDGIYDAYLKWQIELGNGEYEKANNTNAVFEAEWRRFVAWFCNRYKPAQGNFRPTRGAYIYYG